MKLTIKINLDNSAFEDPQEVFRVLDQATGILFNLWEGSEKALVDGNGNTCGKAKVTQ